MHKKLLIIIATVLTVATVKAEIYHSDCKEDLRTFMRQSQNYEILGLTSADTSTWYNNENWVSKVEGLVWIEADSFLRIDSVKWGYKSKQNCETNEPACTWYFLVGKLKLNSNYITYLNCAESQLTELDISKNIILKHLNCSNSRLASLDLSNNIDITKLYCDGNFLTELDVSNNTALEALHCIHNYLRFSTLPVLNIDNYVYWHQYNIDGGIKSYLDTVDLSSEYEINGFITDFKWFDITDGMYQTVTPQPTNENGVFTFTEGHTGKKLQCRMTNHQFPLLDLMYDVEIKTVNINETPETNFTVSPNPAQDKLTIHHSKGIGNIGLYDLSGRLLRTYTVSETSTVLDIFDLDNGIYFITVDGKSVKFIKE